MVNLTNTILYSHSVAISVTAGSTVTLNGTLWYSNTALSAGAGLVSHRNDYWGDPAFVDPENGDHHLGPSSAALDRGVDAGMHTDIDDQPRPYQPPDLGADEYWTPGVLKTLYFPLILREY